MRTLKSSLLLLLVTLTTLVHAKKEPSQVVGSFGKGATVARVEPLHDTLDKRTISDLELTKFIKKIHAYAPTTMSRDRLTWWLTHPSLDPEEIVKRQRAISEIAENDELFETLQAIFAAPQRGTFRGFWARMMNAPDLMGREALAKTLESRTFGLEYIELMFAVMNVYALKGLVERIETFTTEPLKSAASLAYASFGLASSPVLVRGYMPFISGVLRANQARRLESELLADREFTSERLRELAQLCKDQQGCARTVARLGRLHPATGRGYVAARMSGVSPLLALPAALYERRASDVFLKMVDTVIEFETYYAAAKMLRERKEELVWPTILQQNPPRLNLAEGKHPFLWISKKKVVPNSLRLNAVDKKGYVITGPNTGGKTTFQQTKLLLAIMAMAGLPVPAESMEITPSIVMTDFKNDDANENEEHSMFKAQTVRTAEIANKVLDASRPAPMIVALDEILTGTSDTEHDALERGTLKTILDTPDTLVTIATHERSLADMSKEFLNLGNLKVTLEGHSIEDGVSTDYNAVDVLRRAGAPDRLLELGRMYLEREVSGYCDENLSE